MSQYIGTIVAPEYDPYLDPNERIEITFDDVRIEEPDRPWYKMGVSWNGKLELKGNGRTESHEFSGLGEEIGLDFRSLKFSLGPMPAMDVEVQINLYVREGFSWVKVRDVSGSQSLTIHTTATVPTPPEDGEIPENGEVPEEKKPFCDGTTLYYFEMGRWKVEANSTRCGGTGEPEEIPPYVPPYEPPPEVPPGVPVEDKTWMWIAGAGIGLAALIFLVPKPRSALSHALVPYKEPYSRR